jgi:hypothetical protein
MSSSNSSTNKTTDLLSSIKLKIDWFFWISLILFIISVAWSGWGMYLQFTFEKSNDTLIYLILLLFIIPSALIFIQQKNNGNIFLFTASIFLCLLWLIVSPIYNSMTLCARYAVQAEVIEQYKSMSQITSLYRDRDDLCSIKIIPKLQEIHIQIGKHKVLQSMAEHGGCGPICNKLTSIFNMMSPSIASLSNEYSEDNLGSKAILEELNYLSMIISDPSASIFDLLTQINNTRNSVIHSLKIILAKDSPVELIKDCKKHIDKLYKYLEQITNNSINYNSITVKAAREAMKAMNHTKSDLNKLINEIEEINLKIENSDVKKEIGVEVLPIDLNILLILKHWKEYFNLMILAFFIDILAVTLILSKNLLLGAYSKSRVKDRK